MPSAWAKNAEFNGDSRFCHRTPSTLAPSYLSYYDSLKRHDDRLNSEVYAPNRLTAGHSPRRLISEVA